MASECGKLLCDDQLEIVKITPDLYDQAIEIYQKYFMKYENVSIATNLLGSKETIDEMLLLIKAILNDGVSFGAKHRQTNQLVSICVSKIIHPAAGCTLDEVFSDFRTPQMAWVGDYLTQLETGYDLFAEWQIECIIEIVFLSTRPDYERKGLAASLSRYTMEYARQMLQQTLPASEVESLPAHVRHLKPQAVTSVFTSAFSQRVGSKLGFEVVCRIPNSKFIYEGKTFAELIDPVHVHSEYAALRL